MHTLNRFYADDVVVRSPAGVDCGQPGGHRRHAGHARGVPRQASCSVRMSSGAAMTTVGSCHRIGSCPRPPISETGSTAPPRASRLKYRIIADCAARDGQIYDEWLIRDQGAIVRMLGVESKGLCRRPDRGGRRPRSVRSAVLARDVMSPVVTADLAMTTLTESDTPNCSAGSWQATLSAVRTGYDRAAHLELPERRHRSRMARRRQLLAWPHLVVPVCALHGSSPDRPSRC